MNTDNKDKTESVSISVYLWPLIVISVVALGLRLYGLRYGLPAVYNPDEVAIMSRALAFAKGDLNPHNFVYPSFYFYVLFAWEGLTAVVAVATRAVASFGEFQREFFVDPTRVFVAGRLLTALLGTGTALATGVLGTRMWGRTAGLAAALIVAVSPLHVLNSHYVKHDVPMSLLVVLAYLSYWQLWTTDRKDLRPDRLRQGYGESAEALRAKAEGRSYLTISLAATITGVAFSTHYYAIFLAIPLAWSAARGASGASDAVKRIALAGAVSAVVFLALSPFILVEPQTAIRDMVANRQIVVDRAVENLGYVSSAMRYASLLFFDTVSVPAAVLALGGVTMALITRPRDAAWLLAFAAPFLIFIASTFPASRYLVLVVPFLALFAGAAVSRIETGFGMTLVGFLIVPALIQSLNSDHFIRQTDTRTLAKAFIESHVPDAATILTQPYSVPLEPTADSLREAVAQSGKDMPTKTRLQMERSPYPSPAYRLIYLGFGLDADKLYLPVETLGRSTLPPEAGRYTDALAALRREHVAFVVLKRYNESDPATLPFLAALAREGRRIAVFSPYRNAAEPGGGPRAVPFLHNTDARIDMALERPGPVVEIWQIDGPRS